MTGLTLVFDGVPILEPWHSLLEVGGCVLLWLGVENACRIAWNWGAKVRRRWGKYQVRRLTI
jgi:hypothetical protein